MADVSPESAGQAPDSQTRRRTMFGVAGIVLLTAVVGWAVFSNGPASTPDEQAGTDSGPNSREEDHFGLPAPQSDAVAGAGGTEPQPKLDLD